MLTRSPPLRWLAVRAIALGSKLLLAGFLAALALGFLALAGRPGAWSGGPGLVLALVLAIAGTSALAVVLAGALLGGFLLRGQLEGTGTMAGLQTLGWGPRHLALAGLPVLSLCLFAAGFAAFSVEPAAWTAVHAVKGSPAVTAVVLSRLARGEVVAVPGGAVVQAQGRLEAALGATQASVADMSPQAGGWQLDDVRVEGASASWSAARIRLVPTGGTQRPANPLTRGWGELRTLARQGGRSSLVWHRRHALAVLAPLLACLGFGLGGRGRRQRRPGVWVGGAALGLFLAARGADQLVADGLLAPTLGGWAPCLLGALMLLASRWR